MNKGDFTHTAPSHSHTVDTEKYLEFEAMVAEQSFKNQMKLDRSGAKGNFWLGLTILFTAITIILYLI